ncbi:MAG TPA: hypothetical protein VL966_10310 [Alphaproteobacteria bacterium]|jgi:hypothetical protein|nr:hypothetical protein [Alphaproteobacteria bacterium]
MKILLHAFGTFAITMRHLVEEMRAIAPDIEWAVVLPTGHQRHVFRDVIPDRDILCLEDVQPRRTDRNPDLSQLRGYWGNVFLDVETEKRTFKHLPASEQLGRAVDIYRAYKDFAVATGATHILISQIEHYEGKMLVAVGHELGLEVMVPVPARTLGGTFYASDAVETLPPQRRATPKLVERATAFVRQYRETGAAAAPLPKHYDPSDEVLPNFRQPLAVRTLRYVARTLRHPETFERDHLRASLLNNLPRLRDTIWAIRARIAAKEYDVDDFNALPKRFVYYPLQTTPESSINTPAPYFVDQLRAIDAIRFAMPNDCLLVVKEHPSSIITRPVGFVRALRRRAGVVVAHYRMSSRDLVMRAACTLSVTGTATLEAFLLGRPSLVLGPSLIASYLGGVCPIDQLRPRLVASMSRPPTDDEVITAAAEILSVSRDFTFVAPGYHGEPALRRRNIRIMSRALLERVGHPAAADNRVSVDHVA